MKMQFTEEQLRNVIEKACGDWTSEALHNIYAGVNTPKRSLYEFVKDFVAHTKSTWNDFVNVDCCWVLHQEVYNVDTGYIVKESWFCTSLDLAKKEMALRVDRHGQHPIRGTLHVDDMSARWCYANYAWRLYIEYVPVNSVTSPE